ncbi:Threonine synthase [Rhodospirillaceae bacterium LM-1]|nr:Threonine synthase [Rhodospirillaceae bacterium LM-1]
MALRYISTRGRAPALKFEDVLLAGLARDGGLYVPESWPAFTKADLKAMRGLSYAELAARVMQPFVGRSLKQAELLQMCAETYAVFDHAAVAPLRQIGRNQWVMELFHGPTLAFKDFALQLLGRLFDHVLTKRGERVCIVGATSGDTGSAAIEACRGRASLDIVILHPKGRVSDVQRRQMTTVAEPNVHNIAIEGSFDDCQDLVKAMFNDQAFRDSMKLSAVNSINWARIMAQIAYYMAAGVALGAPDRGFTFAVPTGNFGNVFAGYAARKMGLPIDKLVVGSNANDILTRFLSTGAMTMGDVIPTLSPSMDIQVSSNFERLLFLAMGRNGSAVEKLMSGFRADGEYRLSPKPMKAIREMFEGRRFDDAATKAAIKGLYKLTGEIFDPHSAIGVAAGLECHDYKRSVLVSLATAHPAKFPDAIEAAIGQRPALPKRLADLHSRKERYETAPNDLGAVQELIRACVTP